MLAARGLALVLAAVALAEAVEHLVLAGGVVELGVALGDLDLALLELACTQPALRLDALEERLAGQQVGGADRPLLGGHAALFLARMLEARLGACAARLTLLERREIASASSRWASFSLRSRTARTRSRRKRNADPVTVWLSVGASGS